MTQAFAQNSVHGGNSSACFDSQTGEALLSRQNPLDTVSNTTAHADIGDLRVAGLLSEAAEGVRPISEAIRLGHTTAPADLVTLLRMAAADTAVMDMHIENLRGAEYVTRPLNDAIIRKFAHEGVELLNPEQLKALVGNPENVRRFVECCKMPELRGIDDGDVFDDQTGEALLSRQHPFGTFSTSTADADIRDSRVAGKLSEPVEAVRPISEAVKSGYTIPREDLVLLLHMTVTDADALDMHLSNLKQAEYVTRPMDDRIIQGFAIEGIASLHSETLKALLGNPDNVRRFAECCGQMEEPGE